MGGVVSSLFGGGQSQPTQSNTQIYQPQYTSQIDPQLANLLLSQNQAFTGSGSPYSQLGPDYSAVFNSQYNNPYATSFQSAANQAGTASSGVGSQAVGTSGALTAGINQLLPYEGQTLTSAFDPQSALYNQLLQQTTDTANVTNAQQGLTGQQAAGNTNQALTNFNIDWQSQELARQLSGLSGVSSSLSQAGQAGNQANALGSSGIQNIIAGGQLPYNAAGTVTSNQDAALQQYLQMLQANTGNLQNYLTGGIDASTAGANAAQADYQLQQQGAANLGAGLGGIANLGVQGYNAYNLGNLVNSIGASGSPATSIFSSSQLGNGLGNVGQFGGSDSLSLSGATSDSGSFFSNIAQYLPDLADFF